MTHIYIVGQQIKRDGTWRVTSTEPLGKMPNGNISLDELVFVRNVRKDGTLGKFSATFWALFPETWNVKRHCSHGRTDS